MVPLQWARSCWLKQGCLKLAHSCPGGEGVARGVGRVHGQDVAFSSGAPLSEISPATLQTRWLPSLCPLGLHASEALVPAGVLATPGTDEAASVESEKAPRVPPSFQVLAPCSSARFRAPPGPSGGCYGAIQPVSAESLVQRPQSPSLCPRLGRAPLLSVGLLASLGPCSREGPVLWKSERSRDGLSRRPKFRSVVQPWHLLPTPLLGVCPALGSRCPCPQV